MPGTYTLEWKNGRKEKLFGHRGYYYVFPDRTLLSFPPVPAWCHQCGQIRLCENLEDEWQIRQELADLSDPASARVEEEARASSPVFSEAWKRRLVTVLQHVLARRLPPSCLYCGERQVSYFKEGEWAPHPGTGEEVRFYGSGMCSTDFAMKFYDIDGNLLNLSLEERRALFEAIQAEKDH